MKRLYDLMIQKHLNQEKEMLFLSGPRQVGKTTCTLQSASEVLAPSSAIYLNWDIEAHRSLILEGQTAVMRFAHIEALSEKKPILIFDEIHKYDAWKNFMKGLFDGYGSKARLIVTGSARPDIYKKGGDSLMGRYFPYRIHPLSLRECIDRFK